MSILNPTGKMILDNHMVMSCELRIYALILGGVRIEDDVVLIDNVEIPLNKSSKKLLVLEG
ncbi:hypothetical protein RyT2_18840 [Pseudolactococcus yaeyamensis]